MKRPRSSRCSRDEVHGAGCTICISSLTPPAVDRLGHRRPVRLGVPVEQHQGRSVWMVAVEQAEQSVQLLALPAANLVEAGHVPVHGFPLATTRARWRWSIPYHFDDSDGLCSGFRGKLLKPLLSGLTAVGCREEAVTPLAARQRQLLSVSPLDGPYVDPVTWVRGARRGPWTKASTGRERGRSVRPRPRRGSSGTPIYGCPMGAQISESDENSPRKLRRHNHIMPGQGRFLRPGGTERNALR